MTEPNIPWNLITPDMVDRAAHAIAEWHYGEVNDEDYILARRVLAAALEEDIDLDTFKVGGSE